jgi:peptide-methionine (S)-S-oxide reductase
MPRLLLIAFAAVSLSAATFPVPAIDLPSIPNQPADPAILAGGCYWGMQAVFERLHGVLNVTAGYAGAAGVKDGGKGHAEAVRILYNPAIISYGTLLEVFFAVAHDPTDRNFQGPDIGIQYRSAIFYATEAQRKVAQAYIDQLTQAKVFYSPIVTQLTPFTAFYPEEQDQQHYVDRHPDSPYVVENDLPKLDLLERAFRPLVSR